MYLPWRSGRLVSPKYDYISTRLHGVVIRKNVILIFIYYFLRKSQDIPFWGAVLHLIMLGKFSWISFKVPFMKRNVMQTFPDMNCQCD